MQKMLRVMLSAKIHSDIHKEVQSKSKKWLKKQQKRQLSLLLTHQPQKSKLKTTWKQPNQIYNAKTFIKKDHKQANIQKSKRTFKLKI